MNVGQLECVARIKQWLVMGDYAIVYFSEGIGQLPARNINLLIRKH